MSLQKTKRVIVFLFGGNKYVSERNDKLLGLFIMDVLNEFGDFVGKDSKFWLEIQESVTWHQMIGCKFVLNSMCDS